MLKRSCTVYRDVLESRQVGRMFKFVNPKHKGWASVCNDSFSLNLLLAKLKYVNSVSVYFYFDKNLYIIDFRCDLPNNDKQKQVKATEVYLLWIFCKNKCQATGDQYRRETEIF